MLRITRLIALVFLCLHAAGVAVAEPDLAQRIEGVVPEGFSGQIVIGTVEGVTYSGDFGLADREQNVAVDADTVFDIGSITKTFTATAILKLVAAGKLSLEQTLADWFENLPATTGAITIHQLLSHTSGLPLYSGDDDVPCDRACFEAWLAATTPKFAPGARFDYSNPGYSALARIVEKASGLDYEQFLDEALLTPLGIGSVGYRNLPANAVYAVGYYEGERVGTPPEMNWAEDGPPWHLRGNGGLICSAQTLYRWLQATASGRTLPRDIQRRQLTGHSERRDGVDYGYGWGLLHKPWGEVVDHTGGNGFFFADARWFRDRGVLLAITNNAFDQEQAQLLLEGLRDVLGMAEPPPQ